MTHLRFTSEVGADSPLRDEHDRMIDLDNLPLSGELRAALAEWADAAGGIVNVEVNPVVPGLRVAGQELCHRTAAELGDGYELEWDWLTPSSGIGDGAALLLLLVVVAVCLFGTILSLPYSGGAAGIALIVAFVDVPILAMAAVFYLRRRSLRRAP